MKRVDHAADAEARDHDAGDRCMGFAGVAQQDRHVGKDAEQEQRFDEHRPEAILRQRIAEDGTIVRNERRQVETSRRFIHAAKAGYRHRKRDKIDRSGHEEHATPAHDVTDHTGAGRTQQIAAS